MNYKNHNPLVPISNKLKELTDLCVYCWNDLMASSFDVEDYDIHIKAAVDWLKLAQNKTGNGGVSYGYSLRPGRLGWGPAYRETTGYIAETFFDLANYYKEQSIGFRAITMSNWLLSIQNQDGSISNPRFGESGIVFDTGQVLFGYLRAYQETNDLRFKQAAIRAGNWLVQSMDDDGAWRKFTHLDVPHTYNTRVAWALAKLGTITQQSVYTLAAQRNLEWSKTQVKGHLFEKCAFELDLDPFVHTIAYAIRGFLESAIILENDEYLEIAENASRAVFKHIRADGFIPGQISTTSIPEYNYCCLTGNCQMAIIGFKLYNKTGDVYFKECGKNSLMYVMRTQNIHTKNENIRGAIKGSQPFWGTLFGTKPIGGYSPLVFPNWATKFFVEAIIELKHCET